MGIQHFFTARLVDHTGEGTLTDGSIMWEVVTDDGERVATSEFEEVARDLETKLNMALTEWAEVDEFDRVVELA